MRQDPPPGSQASDDTFRFFTDVLAAVPEGEAIGICSPANSWRGAFTDPESATKVSMTTSSDCYFTTRTVDADFAPPPGDRNKIRDARSLILLSVDLDGIWGKHSTGGRKGDPFDPDEVTPFLDRFPLPPSLLIDTGGGFHAHWVLAEPIPFAESAELRREWRTYWKSRHADAGKVYDDMTSGDRIMRVPGTFSYKTGNPVPVRLMAP